MIAFAIDTKIFWEMSPIKTIYRLVGTKQFQRGNFDKNH